MSTLGDRMNGAGARLLSPCATCVWKHLNAASCEAFPDGIPEPILDGSHLHRDPYPNDHGYRYERVPNGMDRWTE